jgi:tetratricopeptide (TPR) repeat protein
MNYVTVMSRKGERSLLEGKRREALVVFKNVEKELLSAAKLFKDAGSTGNAAYALQQVGQIYRHVYRNEPAARAYFNKALEIDPAAAQTQPN